MWLLLLAWWPSLPLALRMPFLAMFIAMKMDPFSVAAAAASVAPAAAAATAATTTSAAAAAETTITTAAAAAATTTAAATASTTTTPRTALGRQLSFSTFASPPLQLPPSAWSPIYQLNQQQLLSPTTTPRRDRLPPGFEVVRVLPADDGRQRLPSTLAGAVIPSMLVTKLLGSDGQIQLNSPYYYPDSATVVFPGAAPQSVHATAIYPILISPTYPAFPYPEVAYPIGGGTRPHRPAQQGDSWEQQPHHQQNKKQKPTTTTKTTHTGEPSSDERIICQEHVKRVKGRPDLQKTPTYIAATNGIPLALKIFPHPQWMPISRSPHHHNLQQHHY